MAISYRETRGWAGSVRASKAPAHAVVTWLSSTLARVGRRCMILYSFQGDLVLSHL
jgi:hypothetical protein